MINTAPDLLAAVASLTAASATPLTATTAGTDPLLGSLLSAVWSASVDAQAVVDLTGTVLAANDAFADLWGVPLAMIVNRSFSDLVPAGMRASMLASYRAIVIGAEPAPLATTIQRPDGELRQVELRFAFVDLAGARVATVILVRDVTAFQRREADRRRLETKFEMFFEEVPGATYIYVVQEDGKPAHIVHRSHQYLNLTGAASDAWEGADFTPGFVHPDDQARVLAESNAVEVSGEPYDITYRIRTVGRGVRWVHERARQVRSADGQDIYWIGIVTDITERKDAELALADALERVEAANRKLEREINSRSEFLSALSHELRTPLTTIQGFSELITTEVDTLDQAQAFATTIHHDAERLRRLVNDLLDLDRMTAGKLRLTMTPVAINDIVTTTLAAFQPVVPHGWEIALDPAAPLVLGDSDRLVQALTNLVANAVKYSPTGGVISVRTAAGEDTVEVAVGDTGLGVPPEFRESIFRQYERIPRPEQRGITGTGLGLPITRQIMQLHGGTIWVEPNTPRGSIFRLKLPRHIAAVPAPPLVAR